MIPFPARDRDIADRFEDLASALAAGLPVPEVIACAGPVQTPPSPGASLTQQIEARLRLANSERLVFAAAEKAGHLDRALRERAAARRLRAQMVGGLGFKLAYPLFLILAALATGVLVGLVGGGSWRRPALVLGLALLGLGFATRWFYRRLVEGRTDPAQVPGLGSWLLDVAEVPVLQTLHGLYAAGVRIDEALPLCASVAPFGRTRTRLRHAAGVVGSGHSLSDALVAAGALHQETRTLLGNGERAGDLEGALERATQRRVDTLERTTALLARIAVATAMALAFAIVTTVIFASYAKVYTGFGR